MLTFFAAEDITEIPLWASDWSQPANLPRLFESGAMLRRVDADEGHAPGRPNIPAGLLMVRCALPLRRKKYSMG